ncbi:MAG TPA: hypothetical protein VNC78_10590 [Actinomycetota bacterium]|nr:hypothetical protein [Actinomycetota bacterium]
MRKLCIGLALTLLMGTACWPLDRTEPLSEMELEAVAGDVVVLRDGERIEVGDSLPIEVGDVIETAARSEARLRLEGDRIVSLSQRSRLEVRDTDAVEGLAGHLLAQTKQPLTVYYDKVEMTTKSGTFRLDRGVATARAGVYRGTITASSPGEPRLSIGPLYEASMTANDIPPSARPYNLDVTDPWDVRLLPRVVALEEELERLGAGLSNQLGERRPTVRYFASLSDKRDVGFIKPYLREKDADDLVLGFAVAKNAGGPLEKSFSEAFSIHDDGGSWGIVAGIMDVRSRVLLADLETMIVDTGIVASAASEGAAPRALAAAGFTRTDPSGSSSNDQPPPPPDSDPPPPEPAPSDQPCAQDDVECQVGEVGEQLPDPTATPTPTPPPSQNNQGKQPKPGPSPTPTAGEYDVIGSIFDQLDPQ